MHTEKQEKSVPFLVRLYESDIKKLKKIAALRGKGTKMAQVIREAVRAFKG
jgi:hypothetical protein